MRTITTILHDDSATGVKTIEFTNRLIKGIYIPRVDFKKLNQFAIEEMGNPGVYFLIGEGENEDTQVYIGQATHIKKRLDQHLQSAEKDFRKYAVAFTNKEGSLTESDINYLERELITRALKNERAKVFNKNTGNTCLIQSHRKADMHDFLSDLEILLSSLGFLFLKPLALDIQKDGNILYSLTGRGARATGILTQEGFLVYKGSTGPKDLVPSEIKHKRYAWRNRPKLQDLGVIKEEGDNIVFLKDYLFSSPSSAANIIVGRSANGRVERKDKNNKTLAENEKS